MTEPTPAKPPPPAARRALFRTTEGDLWRWQLETMTELTKFIRAHGPGRPGALPAVPWHISTGFHAVARLSVYDSISVRSARRDLRGVLAAYAAALGSEVTPLELGDGDTEYRVTGTLGERDRIKLTVIATIRADDHQADDGTEAAR